MASIEYMLSRHDDSDFTFPQANSQGMYSQEIYGFESMKRYLDDLEYNRPRTSQDSYPLFSSFAAVPMYLDASQQFVNSNSISTVSVVWLNQRLSALLAGDVACAHSD
jgi:hypothetical protein